jgi:soluble lytic murein transglycosylase-like protein
MSVFIFVLITAVLFSFVVFWGLQRKELENLSKEEMALSLEVEQLNTIGNWTLEYVKIDKAVDFLSEKKLSEDARRRLTEQLWQISHAYSIDPLMILAVVAQESHGNPNARGRMQSGAFSGALGLMQIKLETAQKMAWRFGLRVNSEEDLFKPEVNVTVGTAYLIRLIGKYGSWKEALIAYNLGHSAVDRLLERGQPLPLRYYERVISKYQMLVNRSFL